MLTEHTNTVYDCGGCGYPIYFRNGWWHYSTLRPCPGLEPVPVRLTIPMRRDAS